MDRRKFHKADDSPKYQGVYYRESDRGKIWWICYRKFGKLVWERVGHEQDNITKVHAREYRAEKMREIRIGQVLPGEKPKLTVADAFKMYASSIASDGIKFASDLSRYNNHIHPYIGSSQLGHVTSQVVISMKEKWNESGLASGTRRQVQSVCSRIFKHAIDTGMWNGKNPFEIVSKPNISAKRERYLTEEEAHRVLGFLKQKALKSKLLTDLKVYQAAAISLFTGLRKSEIRRLTKRNLLNNCTLIRVKTKHRRRSITRHVQIPAIARSILQSIQWPDSDRYFGDDEEMTWIVRKFVLAVEEMGLNDGAKTLTDRITFHSLRHTYGSWHAINGTPLNVIRELMGHAHITTTERYLHLIPDHKEQAMDKFSQKYLEITSKIQTSDDYKEEEKHETMDSSGNLG